MMETFKISIRKRKSPTCWHCGKNIEKGTRMANVRIAPSITFIYTFHLKCYYKRLGENIKMFKRNLVDDTKNLKRLEKHYKKEIVGELL